MEAYLDNSATTVCSERAAEKMMEALRINFGNPSSLHMKGVYAERYLRESRAAVAKTLRCREDEIIFTSGGTESNNLAIFGTVRKRKRMGKHVITTPIEHASVTNPFSYLESMGYEVTYLPVDKDGIIDLHALSEAVRADTVLVSIMHVNNEIGAVEPIEEAAGIIHSKNPDTYFHVDAIQSYGKFRIYPDETGIDLMSVSGHKIHGPKGSGFLFRRKGVLIDPIILGGGQEGGMRSGTENVPAIAGLGAAAVDMYKDIDGVRKNLFSLKERFVKEILETKGCHINGKYDETSAPQIISVSFDDVRAEVMLHALEDRGVYVSSGSACSSNRPAVSRTLKAIGVDKKYLDSTVRFSLSPYNTEEEIDYAVKCVRELLPILGKFKRH